MDSFARHASYVPAVRFILGSDNYRGTTLLSINALFLSDAETTLVLPPGRVIEF
jgi:hypothetical protein